MATTHEPLNLGKLSSVQWNVVVIPKSFIWIIVLLNGPFEYGDGGIFKLQNLHQSTWDHKILYAERSSQTEQFLNKPTFAGIQKCEYGGRLKVKINVL
jgi:hypothetical protein